MFSFKDFCECEQKRQGNHPYFCIWKELFVKLTPEELDTIYVECAIDDMAIVWYPKEAYVSRSERYRFQPEQSPATVTSSGKSIKQLKAELSEAMMAETMDMDLIKKLKEQLKQKQSV